MGMYTELNIGVAFNKDAPKDVTDKINEMVVGEENWILRSGGSYYFNAQPTLVWKFDTIAQCYFLTVCTNIKNYGQQWEEFLELIAPHVEEGYAGTYRYEEDEDPTLIYFKDKKVVMRGVK